MRRKRELGSMRDVVSCVKRETGSRPEAVCEFLFPLAEEAYEIADHLRSNWGDERGAARWDRIGRMLDRQAEKCESLLPWRT